MRDRPLREALERAVLAVDRRQPLLFHVVVGAAHAPDRPVEPRLGRDVRVLGDDQVHARVGAVGARLGEVDVGARAGAYERVDLLDVLLVVRERLARHVEQRLRRPRIEEASAHVRLDLGDRRALVGLLPRPLRLAPRPRARSYSPKS